MNKQRKRELSSVGKVRGAFWPGRDTGGEPASCGDGRGNSTVLQDRCVFRVSLEVVTEQEVTSASERNRESSVGAVRGKTKTSERGSRDETRKKMPRALRPNCVSFSR